MGAVQMLMQEATPEMVKHWKSVWDAYRDKLRPNRKSGADLVGYLEKEYSLAKQNNKKMASVITENILLNEHSAGKLPDGKSPSPIAFIVENIGRGKYLYENQDQIFCGEEIFVGIDVESGCFHVEGSSLLWDELFAFQGLDEDDIENYYLVAEYISCLKKFSLLENTLNV
jgi:hypothetical protein